MNGSVRETSAEQIFALLEHGRTVHASDLHVEPGQGAAFRIFTQVRLIQCSPPAAAEVTAFVELTLDRVARARLDKLGMADGCYADDRVGAIRIHASRGRHGPRLAVRLLARAVPELSTLGLPPVVETFAGFTSGLTLVTGPSGSGKSTTLAAILDRLNSGSQKHIVTLEDPVEHAQRWRTCVVTAYEIGRDVASYAEGVRGALRADPNVLFIGELRGQETVAAALQAAETGHAVFAGLHTPSESSATINRIVGLFAADEQDSIRQRLADALRAMVGQRLIPLRDGSGLRVAAEVVVATEAVRRLIRDGAVHQLRSLVASGRKDGMQTLESHLSELVTAGELELAVARAATHYPEDVRAEGRRR